jgi:hypothetical protein
LSTRSVTLVAAFVALCAVLMLYFLGKPDFPRSGGNTAVPPPTIVNNDSSSETSEDPLAEPTPNDQVAEIANRGSGVQSSRGVAPTPPLPLSPGLTLPAQFLEVDRAFAAEPIDLPWARSMETRILGSLAEIASLQLVTVQVECRSSTCRLQFAEREPQDADQPASSPSRASASTAAQHAEQVVNKLELKVSMALSVPDQHGTRTWLLYVVRGNGTAPEADLGAR